MRSPVALPYNRVILTLQVFIHLTQLACSDQLDGGDDVMLGTEVNTVLHTKLAHAQLAFPT